MTIIVQSMGIPSVELHFRQRIYPEVHLLAKLFQNIESNGSASLSQSWRLQGAVARETKSRHISVTAAAATRKTSAVLSFRTVLVDQSLKTRIASQWIPNRIYL
jgi:hypothetical protein